VAPIYIDIIANGIGNESSPGLQADVPRISPIGHMKTIPVGDESAAGPAEVGHHRVQMMMLVFACGMIYK
jgi:hypothetical protein